MRKNLSTIVPVVAACVLFLPGSVFAQPAGAVQRAAVIIGFNNQPGPAEAALVRAFGGTVRHVYRIIPAIAATLPQSAIQALENNPLVSVVEPDMPLHALDEYSTAWGVQRIGAQSVHLAGNKGAAKICVIDSGIDRSHPDLAGRYAGGWDYVNNDSDPFDDNGHGTHVAGTIAAVLDGNGVVGVAPDAQILVYKILDAKGQGSFSNAIAALQACQEAGGTITNNSYGASSDPGASVKAAFDNAYAAGILSVAAAGNATLFSCNSVSYPARYDSVVAVGATDSSDTIAYFSCRGPEVELSGPGVNIVSTAPGSGYATMSGTSMASPHVAGVAALVSTCGLVDLNGDGRVDNGDWRLRMQQTALDLGTGGRDSSYGFGRVRAEMAAMNCSSVPPVQQPPAAPGNLAVTGVGRNFVNLVWTDNSDNEANFEVWRCKGSNCTNFARIATLSANAVSYSDSALSRNTAYRYEVRAVNSGGASAFSNIVAAKTSR